jgi:hypothetical protein
MRWAAASAAGSGVARTTIVKVCPWSGPLGQAGDVETEAAAHPADWWAQFLAVGGHIDPAYLVDGFGDLIERKIEAPLLRREARIATDVVVRYLNRTQSSELEERARAAAGRLAATVARMRERSTGTASTVEIGALSHALDGRYAEAAAAAEPFVGTAALQRLFITALRLERFDIPLALRLLAAGRPPAEAVESGTLIGKYSWWPSWLLRIVTERALAGRLDEDTIAALDRCAYAELSPAQARLARRMLSGDAGLIAASAERLETLGEAEAAGRLRNGDLNAVALAARLVPL